MSSQFKTNSFVLTIALSIFLLISAFSNEEPTPSELIREYVEAGGVLPRNEKIAERIGESVRDFAPSLWDAIENESDLDALIAIAAIASSKLSGEERDRMLIAIKKKINFDDLNPFTQSYFRKLINEEIGDRPDLEVVTNNASVETRQPGDQQNASEAIEPGVSEDQTESTRRTPVWLYVVVAVAIIGMVALLLRTRKGNTPH